MSSVSERYTEITQQTVDGANKMACTTVIDLLTPRGCSILHSFRESLKNRWTKGVGGYTPFSSTSICKVSNVIIPSVKGSSSSLMIAVVLEGMHLKFTGVAYKTFTCTLQSDKAESQRILPQGNSTLQP